MENDGSEDTALSHWEQSWIGSEIMGGMSFPNTSYISKLTLKFFEDSGWYLP